MTWSTNASGHHKSNDWKAEEHELLRKLVDAYEADDATVTSSFAFNGNHIQAHSLAEAREKLAAYDAEGKAGSGEDDGSTTEPEA